MTQQEIERIARLEERMKSLEKQAEGHTTMLREVRDALLSARGARWALMSLIGVSGTFGALLANWWPK